MGQLFVFIEMMNLKHLIRYIFRTNDIISYFIFFIFDNYLICHINNIVE